MFSLLPANCFQWRNPLLHCPRARGTSNSMLGFERKMHIFLPIKETENEAARLGWHWCCLVPWFSGFGLGWAALGWAELQAVPSSSAVLTFRTETHLLGVGVWHSSHVTSWDNFSWHQSAWFQAPLHFRSNFSAAVLPGMQQLISQVLESLPRYGRTRLNFRLLALF